MDAYHRTNTHRRWHDPGGGHPLRDGIERLVVDCIVVDRLVDHCTIDRIAANDWRVDSPSGDTRRGRLPAVWHRDDQLSRHARLPDVFLDGGAIRQVGMPGRIAAATDGHSPPAILT